MNVTSTRWQLAQAIHLAVHEGSITAEDGHFLRWLMEFKNCPLGTPSGEFNAVRLNDRQVRTLLQHYVLYRDPTKAQRLRPLVRLQVSKPGQVQHLERVVRF